MYAGSFRIVGGEDTQFGGHPWMVIYITQFWGTPLDVNICIKKFGEHPWMVIYYAVWGTPLDGNILRSFGDTLGW